MFRKLSSGFRMPSGEVKETPEVLQAREKLSVESTVKEVLELYVSRKNMGAILESTPLIGSSSYFLFTEYKNKPISQIPNYVLQQVIDDVAGNHVPLLKEESSALRDKLSSLMNVQMNSLPAASPASPRI